MSLDFPPSNRRILFCFFETDSRKVFAIKLEWRMKGGLKTFANSLLVSSEKTQRICGKLFR